MVAILRRLVVLEREHAQPTAEELRVADALDELRRELDEVRTRQEADAQVRRENLRPCEVCFDEGVPGSDGVGCLPVNDELPGPDAANGHFVCKGCIGDLVRAQSEPEPEFPDGSIHCPGRDPADALRRCSAPPFTSQQLAQHCRVEEYAVYQRSKTRLMEAGIEQQMKVEFRRRLERELAQLRDDGEVHQHQQHIVERILVLRCPRCNAAFVDFNGCLALTCANPRCGCRFCGLCLRDCGADAHAHVGVCPEGRGQGLFVGADVWGELMRHRRERLVHRYLAGLPEPVRRRVRERVRRDCEDLGIRI